MVLSCIALNFAVGSQLVNGPLLHSCDLRGR
jgi:hypothetical protein